MRLSNTNMAGHEGFSSLPSNSIGWFGHHHQEPNVNNNININTSSTTSKPTNNIPNPAAAKKKRNLPGTPDPDAEVIALSPKSLMATNRFVCEICNKGFQRDQNLQLHRRGHNLPWKLRQRSNKDLVKKKVYICPEKTCVHHDPSRALGDLTGIKKHFSRKHGEKKWKCDKCSKKYAVQSDWKAHSKTCGTREYKCDCGTLFSRKDSFITHRAFCDALAEESARFTTSVATNLSFGNEMMNTNTNNIVNHPHQQPDLHTGYPGRGPAQNVAGMAQYGPDNFHQQQDFTNAKPRLSLWLNQQAANSHHHQLNPMNSFFVSHHDRIMQMGMSSSSSSSSTIFGNSTSGSSSSLKEEPKQPVVPMSATALLQKAAQMGSTRSSNNNNNNISSNSFFGNSSSGLMISSSMSNTISSTTTTMSFNSLNQNGLVLEGSNSSASNGLSQLVMQKSCSSSTSGKVSGDNQTVQVLKLHHSSSNGVENGLTRDFLGSGSGDHNSQRQFLPVHDLGKFGTIGSDLQWG
ncbi:protein indeterminate-domain 9 isoform X2 [Morus notabilis]|uniref:protein indeterminate-domain 9 isoform X2 n=1 Tax=Morus notabilis TaxID=981085 RepID=UPI000CED4BED|nr:protein indeterminate-domain 9 isoform X2 [Morus notabilis]